MSNALKQNVLPLGLAVIFYYTFSATWHELFLMWSNYGRGYDHGFLLLAVCVYLAHRIYQEKRSLLADDQTRILPLFFLAALSLTWLSAYLVSIVVIQEILLPLITLTIIASFYGYKHTKLFAFPVLFIYLALPIWDEVTVPTLQTLTIAAVQFFIKLTGLTAHVYRNYVQIPSGTFEIANSCAGMRYMLIALTLTLLQAYLSFTGLLARALFLLWGLFLSLLANWIRVYLIILIGYKTEMQSSIVGDHEMFGWLVFAVTMAPLFFMTNFFARFDKVVQPKQSPTITRESAKIFSNQTKSSKTYIGASIMLILFLTKGLTFLPGFYNDTVQLEPLPSELGIWHTNQQSFKWRPDFKNANAVLETPYSADQSNVSAHIYAYAQNSQNAELVSDSNKIASKPWEIVEDFPRELPQLGPVKKIIIRNNNEKRLIYAWYKINQFRETQPVKIKLYQLLGYVSGSPAGRFIAISIDCSPADDRCQRAETSLDEFTMQLVAHYDGI